MLDAEQCPVCGLNLTDKGSNGDTYQYDCNNCGHYSVDLRLKLTRLLHLKMTRLSGRIMA